MYRLIEMKLDEPLTDFVAARRLPTRQLPAKSWQEIADEIEQRTGETITGEAMRRWFADSPVSTEQGAA